MNPLLNSIAWIKLLFLSLYMTSPYILLTCWLAQSFRNLVERTIQNPCRKILFLEVIATAEMCSNAFELAIVGDYFGISIYAIFLFLLTIWYSRNWGEATACPYIHIEEVVEGKGDIQNAIFKIWAELLGGIIAYKYMQFIWNLQLTEIHIARANKDCLTDIQVPIIYGAIIEGVATCICRIMSRALYDSGNQHAIIIDSLLGTLLVLAAFNYSGGYFNPVLATSLKFGCKGSSFIDHIFVYWIGSCAGSIASIYLYKIELIQNLVYH